MLIRCNITTKKGKMLNFNTNNRDADKPYDLIDGATGDVFDVTKQVAQQRNIAADKALPIEKRLEAYEDIVDSEVGDTSLVRCRNIERELGFRQLTILTNGSLLHDHEAALPYLDRAAVSLDTTDKAHWETILNVPTGTVEAVFANLETYAKRQRAFGELEHW